MIEIVRPGPWSAVQDLGRPGYAALGVGRSGAFDRPAAALANRLVGNPESAAVLEVTLGGLEFIARVAMTVALCGARCPGSVDWGVPLSLAPGASVRLGTPAVGLRSYLGVRGGIDVTPVLGSRSTDLLSGIGPQPLATGDLLPVGPQPRAPIGDALAAVPRIGAHLEILGGPREDWFDGPSRELLTQTTWTVRSDSNRIGVRLDGPSLNRIREGELASEATLPGAIQVPPDGRPIILGPDAPTTGGYPVIAILTDLSSAAQLRPGEEIRLVSGRG